MLWKYMHRRQVLKPAWKVWEDVADEVSFKLILKARINLDEKESVWARVKHEGSHQAVKEQWKSTKTMEVWAV